MEVQSYADWSQGLHGHVAGRRVPVCGAIEVTRRCNQRCGHCYNNLPLGDPEARRSELTYEEHCRILDEITEAGCLWLLYTGGEIFARKDFLDIYTYAKQKGLLITLFSNGTRITPEIADHFVQWRPFSIEVSIYGRSRATHDRITGIPGSFDRCMRGIRLLAARGLPLTLKTMATTFNTHEIWDMKRLAEEDMGVEFKFDAVLNCRIDCSRRPLALRLTPEEVVKLDLHDPERTEAWRRFADQFNGLPPSTDYDDALYDCGGGNNAFAVDPSGMLRVCVLSRGDTYDLRKGGFQEGWERFLLEVRQKTITRQTKCTSCGIRAMCGMCPANGELENRDTETPVDFLCQVAHLRAYALGLSVPPHGDCEYCEGGSRYGQLMEVCGNIFKTETGWGDENSLQCDA
jgi:radical SAM protein with 4Fe4S-binding SPASM domain